jgi:CheY-like chemotaxis protein
MIDGHRVLVVEDHVDTAEAFAIIFEARGLKVSVASNGADALTILEHDQDFCAILLDLMMPGMDGRTFRRAQRADARMADIPVIIVSGDPTISDAARQLGVTNFLQKPIDPVELVRAVERQCGLRLTH